MPPLPSPSLPPHHNLLCDLIQARLALVLDARRRAELARKIERLAVTEGIGDLQDLVFLLSGQPTTAPLWQTLIRAVAIAETYFFRDQNQFNALRSSVLPDLIAQRRQEAQLHLRLWSAGCATGEEPYTLAILLRELLPDFRTWDITILATDLNLGSLERARCGIYQPWSFRDEMPDRIRQRWFTDVQGGYRLDPSVCEMVTFAPLNLAYDEYPSKDNNTLGMDVILCRNVLIYFDTATAGAVVTRFQNALSQQGWLVLGHSEAAHMMDQDFRPAVFENAVLYQKSLPGEPRVQQVQQIQQIQQIQPIAPVERIKVKAPARVSTVAAPEPPRHEGQNSSDNPQPDPWEQARQAADKEQWGAALHWLAEAEKKQKLRPEIHYLRGLIQLQQEDAEKALASLRRAIYCDSDFVLAYLALGDIYEKQGKYRKARSQWHQAQTILGRLPPGEPVAFNDDLTVEMLSRLIEYRLGNLSDRSPEAHHAAS